MADSEEILKIYNQLPLLRKAVLQRVLVGQTKLEITMSLRNKSEIALKAHLKEIYKNFDECFKRYFDSYIKPDEKIRYLIILFYRETPDLMTQININFGYKRPINPYESVVKTLNESKFILSRIDIKEIPIIQSLGQRFFDSKDHLPKILLESWYKKDPNSFRVMRNKNGRIVGFFIILFIKISAFNYFAKGLITEKDLTSDKILSFKEPQNKFENQLFISAVVGEQSMDYISFCIIGYLIRYIDMLRLCRKIEKIYASSATDSGRKLLQDHFEFAICSPSQYRKDAEDFFEKDISNIDRNLSLFGYYLDKYLYFKRFSSNMDLTNESEWKPIYEFY